MGKNILDLSNIESKDLIHELYERGYFTDLLFCVEDVKIQLDDINEDRDEDNKIVLSEEQKKEVLDESFNIGWYNERMNDDIINTILKY
jgi:hypothetical protein